MKNFLFVSLLILTFKLQAEPRIFAIAGSPAAGKTTFVQDKLREKFFPDNVFIHDCDAVMNSLEGYQADLKLLGSVKAFEKWELPARELAESMLLDAVKAKKHIIYDRTCALPSSYSFLSDIVQKHGYTLIMHVLYVNKEEAVTRATQRERLTGRHIPQTSLFERMLGIKSLWPSYVKLAKQCFLYDNNDPKRQLIAIGKDNKLIILNQERYEAFINQQ